MSDYDYTGKKGKVNITKSGNVSIGDNETNTTYVIKNKKESNYGYNTFTFSANSGTDVIQGYDYNDTLTFVGATDLTFSKTGTGKDLIITKNNDKDKITLKQYFDGSSIKGINVNELYISGKRKIEGTGTNDIITGSNIADKITTYQGNDTVNAGKGKDTITINGQGEKELIFADGDGNDTVVFDNKSAKVTLDLRDRCGIDEFIKSDNDLIITTTYENNKGKDVNETLTLKNVFDSEKCDFNEVILDYYGENTKLDTMLANNYITVNGVKNVFEGTKYNDEITGTKKADTISTGANTNNGNKKDSVWAGKGDDTIIVNGGGTKDIYINNADGTDTINFTTADAVTVNLIMNDTNIYTYEKLNESGSDVDIKRMYYSGTKLKTEITHLTSLQNNATVNVNDVLYSNLPVYNQILELNPKKPNEVTIDTNQVVLGGAKTDKITVQGSETPVTDTVIFSGNGNDEITINQGNSVISGGKGADNIILNTAGTVKINHATGEGNDVVTVDKKPSSLTLSVDFAFTGKTWQAYYSQYMYHLWTGNYGLHKSGDDLIFSTPAGKKKGETITIKDYFADGNKMPDGDVILNQTMHFGSYLEGGSTTVSKMMHNEGIWADGVKDEETGITIHTALNGYKNYFNYSGKGKTVINGGNKGNDYVITLNKNSDLYIDTVVTEGYGEDLLLSANYKNVKAFFNIDADGIVSNENDLSDNFMIFNKGSLTAANVKKMFDNDATTNATGVININNYFGTGGWCTTGEFESITISNNLLGNIFKYYQGGDKKIGEIDMEYWIDSVTEKVSAWLTTYGNGKYADKTAFDVISEGTDKDINAMLKVYQSVGNGAEFDPHYS